MRNPKTARATGNDPQITERLGDGLPSASFAMMIFADAWATKALALGWVAEDVFVLHPTAPAARRDMKGLAWLLANGARVVAINADSADIVTAAGSKQRFYRRGTASDG